MIELKTFHLKFFTSEKNEGNILFSRFLEVRV